MSRPSSYTIPEQAPGTELDLSRNEGVSWSIQADGKVVDLSEVARRYPVTTGVRAAAADRHGVGPDQVLVTAGGDDALLRCFLSRSGSKVVTTSPTFEMVRLYAKQTRCDITEVPWWDADFPIESMMTAAEGAEMVVVVSPNNPTGRTISSNHLRQLSASCPLVVLDAAYVEFADLDLTPLALSLGNVVVVRTLSKAFGLAGLRTGYLVGPAQQITEIGAYGGPYPISGVSAQLGEAALRADGVAMSALVEEVRRERDALFEVLTNLGAAPVESQANFILATNVERDWLTDAARSMGISLRAFRNKEGLERCVRITLPGNEGSFRALVSVLSTVLAPEALLFDLDGVLADVGSSYRRAIVETASWFGADVTDADISIAKAAGNANDDWTLTWRLCLDAGADPSLDEVTARFETLYQGTETVLGLKQLETPLIDASTLASWKRRFQLGIVTGRPRKDAMEFLDRFGLTQFFETIVTREDAPFKPDPAPVRLAMNNLGATRGWMLGDTPDDLAAAGHAGLVPIGVAAPGQTAKEAQSVLSRAAVVLNQVTQLQEILDVTKV